MDNKTVKLQLKIIKIDLLVLCTLILGSLFWANEPLDWIYGFIFGGLLGILNFMLLARTLQKAIWMNPANAQAYASTNYFVRYALMALAIVISLKADYIHALAVAIGLINIKVIILVTNLFTNIDFYKKIFIRKEED